MAKRTVDDFSSQHQSNFLWACARHLAPGVSFWRPLEWGGHSIALSEPSLLGVCLGSSVLWAGSGAVMRQAGLQRGRPASEPPGRRSDQAGSRYVNRCFQKSRVLLVGVLISITRALGSLGSIFVPLLCANSQILSKEFGLPLE